MHRARSNVLVISQGDKLWAIGGYTPESDLSSVEVYDPDVDAWSDADLSMKSVKGGVTGCVIPSAY